MADALREGAELMTSTFAGRSFSRLAAAALLALSMLSSVAVQAQTAAQVARDWGLVGTWSDDCSIPASRQHVWLTYAVRDGKLYYEQELGDSRTSSQIASARLRADGNLEIVIIFSAVSPPQTRLNVNTRDANGRFRTLISKNIDTDEHSIRDGVFAHNGKQTNWLSRCSRTGS